MVLKFQALPEREQRAKAREIACWVSIVERVTPPPAATSALTTYKLSRVQLKELRNLVIDQVAILITRTLPAYEARLSKDAKLAGYITKVKELRDGLLGLSRKIEEAL
jgi:hypothetical protein